MKHPVIRVLSLFLVLVMTLSCCAFAAERPDFGEGAEENADKLNALGLFLGTGTGYDLEGQATRLHGLVMLIRLLGEEDAAKSCTDPCPFLDVPDWGKPYAAYAYKKGYTNGVSATAFDPDSKINFVSYVTFLLRALGYDDSAEVGDFVWDKSLGKAVQIGLMDAASEEHLTGTNPAFYRKDMVDLSLCALTAKMKGSTKTLAEVLVGRGIFTRQAGTAQGVIRSGTLCYTYTAPRMIDDSTVVRTTQTYSLPSGNVTADVITVNCLNPKVSVEARLVNNTLGATAPFTEIVSQSAAKVIVNSNFFEAYSDWKVPIGQLMCSGQFVYGEAGIPMFAFYEDGSVRSGTPFIIYEVTSGKQSWTCFQCNMNNTDSTYGILYTPAYGSSVTVNGEVGAAVTVVGGTVRDYRSVTVGDVVDIPADGFLIYFGRSFVSTDYYRPLSVGANVSVAPQFFLSNSDGMELDGIRNIISGAPCLVDNGEICTVLPAGFQEERFTTMTTPRTAIGLLPDGKFVLVSTGAAKIQQMRELMLQLGCVEAINLDGGGSTALAWDGQVVRAPGRNLTATLHIFVEE